MKHAIYILLVALGLLLASCKKDHDDIPPVPVEGAWREIGITGFAIIWYPDSIRRHIFFEKDQYTQYNQGTVDEYWTHKKMRGIRFSGDQVPYTLQMQHDTLVIASNGGALCGDVRYYIKVPSM